MTRSRPITALIAAALLAAGCGDDDEASTSGTSEQAPADDGGIRSADHDDRDRAAQEEEPNVGTPGNQDPSGGKVDVPIRARQFTPRVIRVRAGQIVVFTNDDDVAHTVRAVGRSHPRSGVIEPGGRYEHTPLTPGTVRYQCTIHRQMTGRLVVEDGG